MNAAGFSCADSEYIIGIVGNNTSIFSQLCDLEEMYSMVIRSCQHQGPIQLLTSAFTTILSLSANDMLLAKA